MTHKKTRALERPGSGYPGGSRLVHCEPGFYTNMCTEAEWMGWMGTSSTLPSMYGILPIDERGIPSLVGARTADDLIRIASTADASLL